jgi:tRNA (adenine37-N6)-methyltransferase
MATTTRVSPDRIGGGGGCGGTTAATSYYSVALGAVLSAVVAAGLSVACYWLDFSPCQHVHARCWASTTDGRPGNNTNEDKNDKELLGDCNTNNQESTKVSTRAAQESKRKRRATLEEHMHANGGQLMVEPIGVVRSVYRLCVGTPRQGLLAPNARGRIELCVPADAVDGLHEYSHVWIVFVFHLNTLTINPQKRPSKISPPALGGGKKVGVLATRSPHRYNPIGITLARLDRIDFEGGGILHLSGIDLVDGTPVLDIKPFVPLYDAPPASQLPVSIPSWVEKGLDARRAVTFSDAALSQLDDIVARQSLSKNERVLEFYHEEGYEANLSSIVACITEVLSIDVRSSFQATKARKGKYQALRAQRLAAESVSELTPDGATSVPSARANGETAGSDLSEQQTRDDNGGAAAAVSISAELDESSTNLNGSDGAVVSTQQIDNLLVRYVIAPPEAVPQKDASLDNGAEDVVTVVSVSLLQSGQQSNRK